MTINAKLLSLVASAKAKFRERTPAQKIRSEIKDLIGDLLELNADLPTFAFDIANGISLSLDGLVDIIEASPNDGELEEHLLGATAG